MTTKDKLKMIHSLILQGYKLNEALKIFEEGKKLNIKKLCKDAYENAERKGFWEDIFDINFSGLEKMHWDNAIAARLALIHTEVSEATEALRNMNFENFKEELADIVIRVADLAGGLNIDLEYEIERKMEKNKLRGYKHGKQF